MHTWFGTIANPHMPSLALCWLRAWRPLAFLVLGLGNKSRGNRDTSPLFVVIMISFPSIAFLAQRSSSSSCRKLPFVDAWLIPRSFRQQQRTFDTYNQVICLKYHAKVRKRIFVDAQRPFTYEGECWEAWCWYGVHWKISSLMALLQDKFRFCRGQ